MEKSRTEYSDIFCKSVDAIVRKRLEPLQLELNALKRQPRLEICKVHDISNFIRKIYTLNEETTAYEETYAEFNYNGKILVRSLTTGELYAAYIPNLHMATANEGALAAGEYNQPLDVSDLVYVLISPDKNKKSYIIDKVEAINNG